MSQQLQKSIQELNNAFDVWFEIEERIQKGHAYCTNHPDDPRGIALLQDLGQKAAGLHQDYEKANTSYKALVDRNADQEAPAQRPPAVRAKGSKVVVRKSKAIPFVVMA